MVSVMEKALSRSRAMTAVSVKKAIDVSGGHASNISYQDDAKNRRRYSVFRGWVHSAIHALAEACAAQEVVVEEKPNSSQEVKIIGRKAVREESKVITDSPILHLLEKPNTIQYREQFVYSFVANLLLTGRGYMVADTIDGQPVLYSLPSTWIRPNHEEKPYGSFTLVNPFTGQAANQDLDPSQVAFAILPDPSNPLGVLPPAAAQERAIKIDDNIQSTQLSFFENGVFPSVLITVGKNPHPDVAAGIRPRLTATQRRQVYSAIRKVSGGVSNYGNPAIIDGLIEKIDRLSPTQNEIGWQSSEKPVRNRILSAYGVHPFILGEEMVGSYAQAYIVLSRFAEKVNTILRVVSTISTDFLPNLFGTVGQKIRWIEKEAEDPSLKQKLWESARQRDDITQNEFRAYMGLAPDEDSNQAYISQVTAPQVINIAGLIKVGKLEKEQGISILIGMGIPDEIAKKVCTVKKIIDPNAGKVGGGSPGASVSDPSRQPGAGTRIVTSGV